MPQNLKKRLQAGVTLIEMMVVMTIIAIMAGAVYPSVASSLDGIRLTSSADEVVAFINGAVERANRRQVAVELMVDPAAGSMMVHSTEAGFERHYELPANILIKAILPEIVGGGTAADPRPRRFYIYPGGTVPRLGVLLANRTGAQRLIRIDPITGAPRIERSQQTAGQ